MRVFPEFHSGSRHSERRAVTLSVLQPVKRAQVGPAFPQRARAGCGEISCNELIPSSSRAGTHATGRSGGWWLAYVHMYDMVLRMKTTLNIDDTVMAELKREAARQNRTMSELVETALRLLLASQRKRGRIPALPKFRSGGILVDVADRDALYHAMEGR